MFYHLTKGILIGAERHFEITCMVIIPSEVQKRSSVPDKDGPR